jgi:hypothetical protein
VDISAIALNAAINGSILAEPDAYFASADEKALEVDHIVPRNVGGGKAAPAENYIRQY